MRTIVEAAEGLKIHSLKKVAKIDKIPQQQQNKISKILMAF
jgi:hypothetical protein